MNILLSEGHTPRDDHGPILSDPRLGGIQARRATNETQSGGNETQTLELSAQQQIDYGRLFHGYEFSEWFFLTYQAAIISVVLLATAWRWNERRQRSRRRARRRQGFYEKSSDEETTGLLRRPSQDAVLEPEQSKRPSHDIAIRSPRSSGSPSSSLDAIRHGNTTPPTKREEENEIRSDSPLLASSENTQSSRHKRPSFFRPRSCLRACLMYQPPPLPLLRRIIPANNTSLIILLLFALNAWYLFFHVTFYDQGTSSYAVLADRAGLLFAANLPWLYFYGSQESAYQAAHRR